MEPEFTQYLENQTAEVSVPNLEFWNRALRVDDGYFWDRIGFTLRYF